ncbi:MAG: hypothetical protein KDD12_09935 [Lewinella sp.]|nr:hypothetical protein [Lewinella sp.]
MNGGELDKIISRYLDGAILPEDKILLEERMLSDPEFKLYVESLEKERLIERYVTGVLSQMDKMEFESRMNLDPALASEVADFKAAYELLKKDRRMRLVKRFRQIREDLEDS